MKTTLIITTYNRKDALKIVLESIAAQKILPDEVIVADDGSSDGTGSMIEEARRSFPVPLIHSWQEDDGFRAASSRNRAIAKAAGDYIIIMDGDMLADRDFVSDHLACARDDCFVQGRRANLDREITEKLVSGERIRISSFYSHTLNKPRFFRLFRLCVQTRPEIKGTISCNMSFFRRDLVLVNGFDEDFKGWGKEDEELVQRLYNAGIKRRFLVMGCRAFHLWHKESDRQDMEYNRILFERSRNSRTTRCANGLDKYS